MPEPSHSIVVVGARGYTGSELLPLLWRHPAFEVTAVASRSAAGSPVAAAVAGLDDCTLDFVDITPDTIAGHPADAYVLALPNGEAARYVEAIERESAQSVVLDLSADYRFDSDWAYGLPERFADRVRGARRIANPGCYATGIQIALAPIIPRLANTPVAFGISGYSGAGSTPSRKNDPEVLRDNLLPYTLAGHMHEKEVSRHLDHPVRFLPHVAAFFRGISLTVSAELDAPLSVADLQAVYEDAWDGCPLIEVRAGIPEVAEISGRHGAIVGGFTVSDTSPEQVAVVCVLDNLLKGAASQALQNLNLAFGLDHLTGLKP
ncbi:MAG: N-acetyl-gamma-glutamyl-phosphate reductase [Xanthomonadales bacterium]|nr:N-acetyl-gamma-glutamyl-phosphate reductase [Xanthomonadales bacterium]